MYKLIGANGIVGEFETVQFIKKSAAKCNILCSREEADAVFAGEKVYAMTNSEDYADCERVAVCEVDGAVENAGRLAFIEAMANIG